MIDLDRVLEKRSREEVDAFARFQTPAVFDREDLDREVYQAALQDGCREKRRATIEAKR